MRFRSKRARVASCATVALALLGSSMTLAGGSASAAPAAPAATPVSLVRTSTSVPGLCSSPSGFITNASGTVQTLRVTLTPASPRAGTNVAVKVFVKQDLSTPTGGVYPRHLLQPQVVVGIGSKAYTLRGSSNVRAFTGAVFPKGFTAKGGFKAPKKGSYKVNVRRIVFNAKGGFSGSWGLPYSGFDVVCSGGANPTTTTTPYIHPKLTLVTRKR